MSAMFHWDMSSTSAVRGHSRKTNLRKKERINEIPISLVERYDKVYSWGQWSLYHLLEGNKEALFTSPRQAPDRRTRPTTINNILSTVNCLQTNQRSTQVMAKTTSSSTSRTEGSASPLTRGRASWTPPSSRRGSLSTTTSGTRLPWPGRRRSNLTAKPPVRWDSRANTALGNTQPPNFL